jgi:hypothetical protein
MVDTSFGQQLSQFFPGPGKDYSDMPDTYIELLGYLLVAHLIHVVKAHDFGVPAGQIGQRQSKPGRQFAVLRGLVRPNIPAHGLAKPGVVTVAQHVPGAAPKTVDAAQNRQLMEQGGPVANRPAA